MHQLFKYFAALSMMVLGAILFSCNSQSESSKYGEIVKGKHWEGLIVRTEALPERKDDPATWTTSKELVLEIEPKLHEHILTTLKDKPGYKWVLDNLYDYKIQYMGFYDGKKKILAISFMHISRVKNGEWKEPFGVLGGGQYYFNVIYDAESKYFSRLSVNADA